MILTSKYIEDGNGVKYAPITTPNGVRWPDGSNLNDKLSAFDAVVIEAPVDTTDPTDPITTLSCEVGVYYRVDVPVETLAITLPEMSDGSTLRGCIVYMTIGTTPAITFTCTAHGGFTPPVYCQDGFALESGETYEVNCVYNGGAWVLAAVTIDTTDVTPTGGGEG